jgi:hypothetical protein
MPPMRAPWRRRSAVLTPAGKRAVGQGRARRRVHACPRRRRRIESAGGAIDGRAGAASAGAHAVATLQAAETGDVEGQYELTIALEIARQPNRANWPYIAVWIEDAARVPVRTLAVWYRSAKRGISRI